MHLWQGGNAKKTALLASSPDPVSRRFSLIHPSTSVQRLKGKCHTHHHEKLQCDTTAESQQWEGADGDSGDSLACTQELQLEGDGSMQVHAGVVLHQLHKDDPAPGEVRTAQGSGTTQGQQPQSLVPSFL